MSMPSNYPRPNLNPNAITCPQCSRPTAEKVKYSWWGGIVGPAMLSLAKCKSCGYQFSFKTGESAKRGIIIYNVVVWAISLVGLLIYWMTASH